MEISKFGRAAGILFAATTFAVTSAEIVGRLHPYDEAVDEQKKLYSMVLKDLGTGVEITLNLGDRKTSSQYSGSISPDGSRIAFINDYYFAENKFKKFFISISDISGRNLTNLTGYEAAGDDVLVWIDNKTIAFLSPDVNNTNMANFGTLRQNGISIVKTDGSGRSQLDYTFQNFKNISTFCFDEKTKRIIFAGENYTKPDRSDYYSEIYSINPDGTDPQKIVTSDPNLIKGGVYDMKYLEDGQISLDLTPNGHFERYIMDPDGSNLQAVK